MAITYEKDVEAFPSLRHSLLLAFDNLENAEAFAETTAKIHSSFFGYVGSTVEVWECETERYSHVPFVATSHYEYFWQNVLLEGWNTNRSVCAGKAPKGTVGCTSLIPRRILNTIKVGTIQG